MKKKRGTKIIQQIDPKTYEVVNEYETLRLASPTNYSYIGKMCNGKLQGKRGQRLIEGHIWRYKE